MDLAPEQQLSVRIRDRKIVSETDLPSLDDELTLLTIHDIAHVLKCSRRSV